MVRIWGVSGRELALIPAEVLDDAKSRGVEAIHDRRGSVYLYSYSILCPKTLVLIMKAPIMLGLGAQGFGLFRGGEVY